MLPNETKIHPRRHKAVNRRLYGRGLRRRRLGDAPLGLLSLKEFEVPYFAVAKP
jgi:hypothetical protein